MNVIVIHVVRGGRDPDEYFQVVTEELADTLDPFDPIKTFVNEPDGLMPDIFSSMEEALDWCEENGYTPVGTMEAEGY